MRRGTSEAGPASNTRRAIVKLLKTEGPMDSAQLAERLGLTAMAIRQHLYELQEQKLVAAAEQRVPLGRPVKKWSLTRDADRLFPDAYAELSVALIAALGDTFGKEGLGRVLESRCARQRADYAKRIPHSHDLFARLKGLAKVRTEEGYMAEVTSQPDGSYLFVENHCPICAAATACQGFCATELQLFESVAGPRVTVERVDHIISGDRRCAYRFMSERPRRAPARRV